MRSVLRMFVCSFIVALFVRLFGSETVNTGLLVSIICILIDKE